METLDNFWFFDAEGKRQFGPSNVEAQGPGLFYGIEDDLGNALYCYQGKWLTGGYR